jgi:hypothetical protein
MMTVKNALFALALGGLLAGTALAQTTTSGSTANTPSTGTSASTTSGAGPGVHDPNHPRVNQINRREQRQQDRIANGVKNDKLTPQQASQLEKREGRLENREKRDMTKDNGHLTKKDQRQLNREANRDSRKIYQDKHDSQSSGK